MWYDSTILESKEVTILKKEEHTALKIIGSISILYGIIYAILGTLSLIKIISGVLPGHEQQKIILTILSYIITIISIYIGVICIKGNIKKIKFISIILTIIGLISFIYNQVIIDFCNNFDGIAVVLGIGIYILAITQEKKMKTGKKNQKQKEKKNEKKENTTKENKKTETKSTVVKKNNQKKAKIKKTGKSK